jgi:large repetitive protein
MLAQVMAQRDGWRAARADQLGVVSGGGRMLDAAERNAARKASGLAGDVQPLVQDEEVGRSNARRVGSIGVWSGGAVEIGTQDATTRRSKITATTSGLSAGVDLKLMEDVTVGVGGGYGNDVTRIDGGAARVRSDNTLVALYASMMPLDDAFIDVMMPS